MELGGGLWVMELGGGLWVMELGGGLWVMELGGGLWVMELGGGLWMLEQGLAELAAEGLPPVEQSVPLDMPQTFCTEILKFFPAMPEAHAGCTVPVSINCLNNNYLNNNKKLCIYISLPSK